VSNGTPPLRPVISSPTLESTLDIHLPLTTLSLGLAFLPAETFQFCICPMSSEPREKSRVRFFVRRRLKKGENSNESIEDVVCDLLDLNGDLLSSLKCRLKNELAAEIDERFREVLGSVACPKCCPHGYPPFVSSIGGRRTRDLRPLEVRELYKYETADPRDWKNPVYVTFRGRAPGVYKNWAEWRGSVGHHPASHSLMFCSFEDAEYEFLSARRLGLIQKYWM